MNLRKIIHISGVIIPILAIEFGKNHIIALVLISFIIYIILEALKSKINEKFLLIFYRQNELKGFSIEPLSYFMSILLLLYLSNYIDERLCFAAIGILAAGDGFAGVVGKKYGKHRHQFNKNSSWEGTISGFIAASIVGFYYAGFIGIIGSVFGMIADAISTNDNITVPFSALFGMLILEKIV